MTAYNFDQLRDRSKTESYKWRKYGPGVIPLWIADMDFASPDPVIHALQRRIEHGIFGYPDESFSLTEDLPDLRWSIIGRLEKFYHWSIQPHDILLLPGIIPGLYKACLSVMQPDEGATSRSGQSQNAGILVQTPVYPPILQAAEKTGGLHQETALQRLPDGTYGVDMNAFKAAITPQTRLFILCNPHNPVGKVFQRQELECMAEICLRNDLVICSDEIHSDLIYPGNLHTPIACLDKQIAERCITLMSPSKAFNLPGLQCAFAIITNPDLRKRFVQAGNGLVSWVGILGMVAAQAAYSQGQEWLDQLLVYLDQNRDYLIRFIRQELQGIEVGMPESTYLAWLDCRKAGFDGSSPETNPFNFFLDKAGVALNDGRCFGVEGQGFVRLNFACPRSRLEQALARMKLALIGGT